MKTFYPVVIFCFNRPGHLKQTVDSLKNNPESTETPLYIFSDGPRDKNDRQGVGEVRNVIDRISGFKEINVRKQATNLGLAASIISGVSEVLINYRACIVLEDDLETSPYFLNYMNKTLSQYEKDKDIFSVSGYCPPIPIPDDFSSDVFTFPRVNSWGWGTWADRWEMVDWDVINFNEFIHNPKQIKLLEQQGKDLPVMLLKQQTGKIASWAVRFNQACFENGKTNIYPVKSLVRNVGTDGTGTHMKNSGKYAVPLSEKPLNTSPFVKDARIDTAFQKFYKPSLYRRFINFCKINHYRLTKTFFKKYSQISAKLWLSTIFAANF